jgi:hypothetical protein
MNLTLIYYTANICEPVLAQKVRENILKVTNAPVISVSQEPIDFGENVCVGKVGMSSYNIRKQILIGAMHASTDYVALVEDDTLYPPDHFDVLNCKRDDKICYNRKVFVLSAFNKNLARKGSLYTGAIIANKYFLINVLKDMIKGRRGWVDDPNHSHPTRRLKLPTFRSYGHATFKQRGSLITVDHASSMHPTMHNVRRDIDELPIWGNARELLKELRLE